MANKLIQLKDGADNVFPQINAPNVISLSTSNGIYQRAIRSQGVGMTVSIPLNRQPTNVTDVDVQYYYNNAWHNTSMTAWGYIGNALVVQLSIEGTLPEGAYGLVGALNITY